MQLRGKVAARSVRAAPAEQHGLALAVAGDEPLRQQHVAAGRQALLQRRVGLEVTGRREVVRPRRGAGALLRVQDRARIEPLHVEAFRGQVRRADARRHQLAGRHDAGPQPVADLSDQVDARRHLAQLDEMPLEVGADRDARGRGTGRRDGARSAPSPAPSRRSAPSTSSCSSRSVMPDSAECTTTGRRPSSRRARTTCATFFQLLTLETLVPPNLRTTQWESELVVIERSPGRLPGQGAGGAQAESSHVVVDVLQCLLQAFLGEHVFELAPRSLATLHAPPACAGRRDR